MNWYYKSNIKSYEVGDIIEICGDEHHHISNVKREKCNSSIVLFDGNGIYTETEIIEINKKNTRCKIHKIFHKINKDSKIVLTVSLLSVNKLKQIVEQIIPLNILEIIIVQNTHSQPVKKNYKQIRDNLIKKSIEVCKVCKLPFLPGINIMTFEKYLGLINKKYNKNSIKLLCSLDKDSVFVENLPINKNTEKIVYYIGPEGDFTENEEQILANNNFLKIHFKNTVFTSVLAAVVFGSILTYEVSKK